MHCDQYWQTAAAAYLNWLGSQLIADIDQSLYMMAQMAAENCESEHANGGEGGEGMRVASGDNAGLAHMQAAMRAARRCVESAMGDVQDTRKPAEN